MQILHVGFATVGPVMNVMCMNEVAGSAPRKTATAITSLQARRQLERLVAAFLPA